MPPVRTQRLSYSSSTIGQPSFYKSLNLAPAGEPGYSRTSEYIGAFNGKYGRDSLSMQFLPPDVADIHSNQVSTPPDQR
jgi:hypothetical protein